MSARISVTGLGLACPLGLRAPPACAAIRAGLDRREFLPYTDEYGKPIGGSWLDAIPAHTPRRQRWLALAACALVDLLGAQLGEVLGRVPLLIAISDPEALTVRGTVAVGAELSRELELDIPTNMLWVFAGGAAAGLRALAGARSLIEQQRATACIVLAADSLVDAAALLHYSQQRRVLTERNSDGFTPGEAAACVFVQAHTRRSWGSIIGLGRGDEPALLDNDHPLRAEGLVAACTTALAEAQLQADEIDFRVSDAAGESYHFKEQALLPARILRQPRPEFPLWLPAAQLGHVGAAAGLCGLVITLTALARGYAPGRRAIVCAGADDGERMVAVVEGPR